MNVFGASKSSCSISKPTKIFGIIMFLCVVAGATTRGTNKLSIIPSRIDFRLLRPGHQLPLDDDDSKRPAISVSFKLEECPGPDFPPNYVLPSNSKIGCAGYKLVKATCEVYVHSNECSNVTYSIDSSTDPDRRFEILQDGSVKVAQNLDYEQQQNYSLTLVGTDANGDQGEITVKVLLKDVNDNAPTVISEPNPCVIMEQEDSDTVDNSTLRCTFEGNDTDTAANGAPFKFTLDNDYAFKDKFRLVLSQDLSAIQLYSKVKVDRENKGSYAIPVQIEDNGVPKLSAPRNLIIQIGDIN